MMAVIFGVGVLDVIIIIIQEQTQLKSPKGGRKNKNGKRNEKTN